jgi:hypothetical protein
MHVGLVHRPSVGRAIADPGDVGREIADLIHDLGRADPSVLGGTQAPCGIFSGSMVRFVVDLWFDVLINPIVNKDPDAEAHSDLLVGDQTLGMRFPDVARSEANWLTQEQGNPKIVALVHA